VSGDKVTRTPDGDGYRLPIEAEWEWSCRAGTHTAWFFGDNPLVPDRNELHQYQSLKTQNPKANPFGLLDMYAGSTEFVWDGFEQYGPEAVVDPVVAPAPNRRVTRGPSVYCHAGLGFFCINSFARADNDDKRGPLTGFGRVALSIPRPGIGK
jgi:formylglycine-generating enzyme required for sulfatase activity